jgi:hypothetical protein
MKNKIKNADQRFQICESTIKPLIFLIQVILVGSILQISIFSVIIFDPSEAANSDRISFRSITNNSSIIDYIPEIPGYSITPRYGTINDQFVLIMTYKDYENTPPKYVQVVIDDIEYDLTPVNPKDQNHSDGKDYFIKHKFSKGVHILYFQTSDGSHNVSSPATTIRITTPEIENTFTHLDVVYGILIATAIFMVPLTYGIYQIHKLGKTISNLEHLKRDDLNKKNYNTKNKKTKTKDKENKDEK